MDFGKIDFLINSNLKSGPDSFQLLPSCLTQMGFARAAIILDEAVASSPYVAEIVRGCEKVLQRCEVLIYTLKGEPTYDYLDTCAGSVRRHPDIEVIVGVGGGSVIDTAKGIAVLMKNEGPGIKYRGFPKDINRPLPVVAVPTTAGTGSEATYNAVFIDTKENKKLGINTVMNFPALSILDPRFIQTCPDVVLASSGMDAVTHAIESFVSKKATLISRIFSTEAAGLLLPNLEKALELPKDLKIKGYLQLGAYLAGIALINSSSGPAGALSYLLGTRHKIPHGIAGAVFLPHIHRFNLEHGYYDYSILYDAIYRSRAGVKTQDQKARWVIDKIFFLNRKLKIEGSLAFYGIKTADLLILEDEAMNNLKTAFEFNPVALKRKDIREILFKAAFR